MKAFLKVLKKVILSILVCVAFLFGIASAIGVFRLITYAINYMVSLHL